jgi:hypothetical protein
MEMVGSDSSSVCVSSQARSEGQSHNMYLCNLWWMNRAWIVLSVLPSPFCLRNRENRERRKFKKEKPTACQVAKNTMLVEFLDERRRSKELVGSGR